MPVVLLVRLFVATLQCFIAVYLHIVIDLCITLFDMYITEFYVRDGSQTLN